MLASAFPVLHAARRRRVYREKLLFAERSLIGLPCVNDTYNVRVRTEHFKIRPAKEKRKKKLYTPRDGKCKRIARRDRKRYGI